MVGIARVNLLFAGKKSLSWISQPEKQAATAGVWWEAYLVYHRRTGHGKPIRADASAQGVGLYFQSPTEVIVWPSYK